MYIILRYYNKRAIAGEVSSLSREDTTNVEITAVAADRV